jgi:hypothetical protein
MRYATAASWQSRAYVRVPESERDLQPEIIGGEAHGEKDEGGGV